jgi:hypothetical protein
VRLHDTYAIIVVDDESWKVVTLTVNKTVAIGVSRAMKTASDAHLKRTRKHLLPEISTQSTLVEAEHTHSNRTDLIVTISKEFAI